MFKAVAAFPCGILACALLSVPAHASFVTGTFQLGSTSINVSPNDIVFYTIPGLVPSTGTPSGNFAVLPPVTGSFVGTTGDVGTIGNLTRSAADSPPYAFAPADTPLAIMNWLTIPAIGITFELKGLASGETQSGGTAPICSTLSAAALAAAGTVCVADATSPFLLHNIAVPSSPGGIDTTFTLTTSGLTWFTATPTQQSSFIGDLGGSVSGQNIGQILNTLATTGLVATSIQGSIITSAVPEPASGYLIVGSLFGILGLAHRRRRKSV